MYELSISIEIMFIAKKTRNRANESLGFGYIEFISPESAALARAAVETFPGVIIGNQAITLSDAAVKRSESKKSRRSKMTYIDKFENMPLVTRIKGRLDRANID
jgi:RNA recognition motif-containing protein